MTEFNEEKVFQVMRAHEDDLLGLPGVIGVGVGLRKIGGEYTDEPAIILTVARDEKAPDPRESYPDEIEGVPVTIQFTGPLSAHHS